MLLSGRTALVTGASSGLGRSFAKALAANGARVAVAARRKPLLDDLVAEISSNGGEAMALAMDVTSAASVEDAYARLGEAWGCADVIVANAGMNAQGRVVDFSEPDLDRILAVNLKGAFLTAQHGARAMLARQQVGQPGGRIILVASIGGQTVLPGLAAYCATKAGVVMLGRSLAREWINSGINVNVICPGYIETELNSAWFSSERGKRQVDGFARKRLMEVVDLTDTVLHLASDRSRGITGSVFTLDDGQSLACIS